MKAELKTEVVKKMVEVEEKSEKIATTSTHSNKLASIHCDYLNLPFRV